MSKQKFIRDTSALFVAVHSKQPSVDQAITWAEALWSKLQTRGYGTKLVGAPRKSINHYATLNAEQKPIFDNFWKRFNKSDGKQRAVEKFKQLWRIIKQEKQQFLEAASNEATLRTQRDTTPPWAQLWLNELRWQDYQQPQQNKAEQLQAEKTKQLRELHAELRHFQTLYKQNKDKLTKGEIDKIQAKITTFTGQKGTT